ncbi:MAG TPA: Mth938-like domain-containing protein [Rubrivivax sp.]
MKFQPDTADGVNVVTRLEDTRLWVGNTPFEHSVLVPWKGSVERWDASAPTELTPRHFERLLLLKPELVIFGSGDKLRFVSPGLYRALIEARIGIETMDTAAACRTYNVLASEGRSVVAALLLGPE